MVCLDTGETLDQTRVYTITPLPLPPVICTSVQAYKRGVCKSEPPAFPEFARAQTHSSILWRKFANEIRPRIRPLPFTYRLIISVLSLLYSSSITRASPLAFGLILCLCLSLSWCLTWLIATLAAYNYFRIADFSLPATLQLSPDTKNKEEFFGATRAIACRQRRLNGLLLLFFFLFSAAV